MAVSFLCSVAAGKTRGKENRERYRGRSAKKEEGLRSPCASFALSGSRLTGAMQNMQFRNQFHQ